MKRCPDCQQTLDLDAFYRSLRSKDGLQRLCKECGNERRRSRVEAKRAAIAVALPSSDEKRCPRCQECKPRAEFHRNRRAKDGLQTYCPPCSNAVRREYEQRNAEALAERRAEKLARAATTGEKKCTKCHEAKLVVEFYRHRGTADGRATYCISCVKADRRAWVAANAERVRAANKQWSDENPDRKRSDHRLYWLRAYGLTPEAYDQLLREQDGACAICGQAETFVDPRTAETRRLAVDHCHTTGRVRGLLCGRCNRSIGLLGDSAETLEKAAAYLRRAEAAATTN